MNETFKKLNEKSHLMLHRTSRKEILSPASINDGRQGILSRDK
jgi:hypothetical protein